MQKVRRVFGEGKCSKKITRPQMLQRQGKKVIEGNQSLLEIYSSSSRGRRINKKIYLPSLWSGSIKKVLSTQPLSHLRDSKRSFLITFPQKTVI